MSTMIKPRSIQQRTIDATARLRQALGLSDPKLLSAALAEVAADEIITSSSFADRIRRVYRELEEQQQSRVARRSSNPKAASLDLIPIIPLEDVRIDPYAALDPYELLRIYGAHQLRIAIDVFSLAKLKEACAIVEAKHPGTRPRNRGRKADIIDYIVEHVAGPGY